MYKMFAMLLAVVIFIGACPVTTARTITYYDHHDIEELDIHNTFTMVVSRNNVEYLKCYLSSFYDYGLED